MNWLVALLAFAGIFAVLSTVTTIVTEGIHKLIAARSGGLQRMLRSLHHTMSLDQADAASDLRVDHRRADTSGKASKAFAAEMSSIPTKRDTFLERLAARTWILKRLGRRFDSLTKLQFVEQLAQTEFGRELATADRPAIERKIALMSYQFDRMGEAQTAVFRMRAKMLSSLAAFAFVVLANVNALEIYRHLASNEEAMSETLQFLNVQSSDGSSEQAITQRISDLQQTLNRLEALPVDSTGASVQQNAELIAGLREEASGLRQSLEQVDTQLSALTVSGLPMGQSYFPYCGDTNLFSGLAGMIGAGTGDDDAGAGTVVVTDAKCAAQANKSVAQRVFLSSEGYVWLFCMIASAGLLGLGAPFWFNVFRTAAQMTGKVAVSNKASSESERQAVVDHTRVAKTSIARPGKEPDLDTQVDVFLINSGRLSSTRLGEEIDQDAHPGSSGARGAAFIRDASRPIRRGT